MRDLPPGAGGPAAPRRSHARLLRVASAIGALGLLLAAVTWLLAPRLERGLRTRIEAALAARGLHSELQSLELGITPPLRLAGLRIEKPGAGSLLLGEADVTLKLRGRGLLGRLRMDLGALKVLGPSGLAAEVRPTTWDFEALPERGVRALLGEPARTLAIAWTPATDAGRLEIRAAQAPLGTLVKLTRAGEALLDAGVVDGDLRCESRSAAIACELEAAGKGVRVAALANGEVGGSTPFGLPADVELRVSASWRPERGALELTSFRVASAAATLSGALALSDVRADPSLTLALDVSRVDFAELLEASGLEPPKPLSAEARGAAGELGSMALGVHVAGRLADLSSFKVTQKLDFTPPRRPLPAIERLRGDFVYEVTETDGYRSRIDVSLASPDFIGFAELPPLFVQTLLVGEDTGFFGHRGVDLGELPAAILVNWARGEPVRGASTITQQLARNLFLSREKSLARKLHELCLALLLESRLSKQRILEIYLNIIEWGPRLRGLRPASRHYFAREPDDLTPKQMAFLVALIPGPLKYQSSFASGTPSPGFLRLVDNLLAKLRSLDALDEAAYQEALSEVIVVGGPETTTAAPLVPQG